MARVAFHALKITEEFEMWGATVGKEDLRTGGFGTMGRRVAGVTLGGCGVTLGGWEIHLRVIRGDVYITRGINGEEKKDRTRCWWKVYEMDGGPICPCGAKQMGLFRAQTTKNYMR
ncbi:hypothetical protein CJ030_MR0G027762 [Morella rubra]|uniref:Uncharacterized protein n=1 Tax=Morella rubra TaxID=262757 RepID=A0A6A1UFV3_9ROSI|nr:hypothetical protein CJ030_MR0G027780 [Morella rubra]KAB1199086.1 hypothetical protein CJ030_MR0G027762 [Morella rubra]